MTDTPFKGPTDPGLIPAFFVEIAIIQQLAKTRLERVLPDGMKEPHFGVLNHMVRLELESSSPAELASAFQVARPTMTNTIQRLEAKNYVRVEPDPSDGRGKRVFLTEEGRAAREKAFREIGPLFSQLINDLGPEPFVKAKAELEKIRIYMDENRD